MNRQQRPRQDRRNGDRRGRQLPGHSNVPTTQQVIPGATVSIVLKADQSTGKEVQGVVKDLFARGDHPRGIKVRLQDGRIGRVQRMISGAVSTVGDSNGNRASAPTTRSFGARTPRDFRLDDPQVPPVRTLADFLPTGLEEPQEPQEPQIASQQDGRAQSTQLATCPFCEFAGDEAAVSHHVDEHLE